MNSARSRSGRATAYGCLALLLAFCLTLVCEAGLAQTRPAAKAAPARGGAKAVATAAAAAGTPPQRGNIAAGRLKAESERCLECHGEAGEGQGHSAEAGKFARLGGQQQDYIVKQIHDFRSGKRKHDFMNMMAKSISDEDLADISAYFAAEPRKPGAGPEQGGRSQAAQRLYQQGDAARQVAACAACHGAAGQGTPGVGPVLAGQGQHYLAQQLHLWRNGARANSPGNTMNQAIAPLSDAEIDALAHYLSEM